MTNPSGPLFNPPIPAPSYTIVSESDPARLVVAVSGFICAGWVPCGGVAVRPAEIGIPVAYLQAMTFGKTR